MEDIKQAINSPDAQMLLDMITLEIEKMAKRSIFERPIIIQDYKPLDYLKIIFTVDKDGVEFENNEQPTK